MRNKLSILYVEDEQDTREGLASFLKRYAREGELYLAADGEEGLELYRKYRPELVIADILMPRMNGMDMVHAIREISPDQTILMLTASSDSQYFIDSIDLKIDGYLGKPIDLDLLREKIEKIASQIALRKKQKRTMEILEEVARYQGTMLAVLDRNYLPVFLNESMRQFMGIRAGGICTLEDEQKEVAREFWEKMLTDENEQNVRYDDHPEILESALQTIAQRKFCELRNSSNRRKSFKLDLKYVEESGDTILTFTEVTRIMRERRKYERRSYTDALTGMMNRFRFNRELLEKIFEAKQSGKELSLLLLDLDHFKRINDEYGHLEGDRVLVEFAERLQNAIEAPDLVARWGGEEFVVLLPGSGLHEALKKAEQLRRMIAIDPFGEKAHAITCSIGVSTLSHEEEETPSSLFEKADEALYRAKELGRNRVEYTENAESEEGPFPE